MVPLLLPVALLAGAGAWWLWGRDDKNAPPKQITDGLDRGKVVDVVPERPRDPNKNEVVDKPANPMVKDMQRFDAGYRMAVLIAADIIQKGKSYSRAALKQFQKTAGIAIDGIYGPESAGAVKWFLHGTAQEGKEPQPLVGQGFKPYVPKF